MIFPKCLFFFLIKPVTLELIFWINSDYRVDIHIWGSKWPKNYKMFYNLEYIFASEYFYSYNYLELKRKIIYIWCKTNNRNIFELILNIATKYITKSPFSNRYFSSKDSKQMEHSFHRKTFINSSRFGPLRIEVNHYRAHLVWWSFHKYKCL